MALCGSGFHLHDSPSPWAPSVVSQMNRTWHKKKQPLTFQGHRIPSGASGTWSCGCGLPAPTPPRTGGWQHPHPEAHCERSRGSEPVIFTKCLTKMRVSQRRGRPGAGGQPGSQPWTPSQHLILLSGAWHSVGPRLVLSSHPPGRLCSLTPARVGEVWPGRWPDGPLLRGLRLEGWPCQTPLRGEGWWAPR